MRDELAELADLDVVAGYRTARRAALLNYALSGRLRGLDGIYVENSTTLPAEVDIAFLALARGLGIPVLTYIRDAQYLFEEYYAASSVKRRLARSLFPPLTSLLRRVSSRVAYPSRGLATAAGDTSSDPILLPPGSPDPVAVERREDARSLLFVGGMRVPAHGLNLLVDAVEVARDAGHPVEVVCVSRVGEQPPQPRPAWLHVEHASGAEIHALLPGVIASITPRRRSPYNDLAVPIKVMEYLSYGRPIIATDCVEQARIIRDADCGLVAADRVDDFAAAIIELFLAPAEQLDRWSANARAAAAADSWKSRAEAVVGSLVELGRLQGRSAS